jgi:PAS domain S-box-containing protein
MSEARPAAHEGPGIAVSDGSNPDAGARAERSGWSGALDPFFELAIDKLCIASTDGIFERLNPAFDALGYSHEELLSRPIVDFVHPDDREATLAELDKLKRGIATRSFENRYRCKDGSYRWLVWNAAPDGAGNVYALAHDITERKRQDEATRQTSLFLEAVLENIPHMVFVKDAERLAFVRFNRAGETLLGVSRHDLLGKTDRDLFPEQEAAFFQAKDRETLEGRVPVDIPQEPIQTRAGQRLLHTTKVPLLDADGSPRYLLGISEDITQRRAGEDARTRLAAIIEASDDAIVSKTLDGIITSWNHGAEKLFGYTAAEAIGHPITQIIPPHRWEEEARAMERLRRNERIGHFETVRRTKDGREIDVSVALSALSDPEGRVTGVSKIARDITAAKRAASERANLETRARAVLDTVVDGIFVIDEAGTISTFNRGAEKIFGVTASEVLGESIELLLPEAGQSPRSVRLAHYGDSHPTKTVGSAREVLGVRRDGSRVPVELSVTEIQIDGQRHFTGVVRDISERKAAEAALARKNEELEVAARIDRIGARLMIALTKDEQTSAPAADVLRVLADEAGYRPLAFYDYDAYREALVLVAGLSLAPGYDPAPLRVGEGLVGEAAARRQPVFVEGSARAPFSLDTGVGVLTASTVFALPLVHRETLLGVVAGAAQGPLLDRERSWLAQLAGQVAIGLSAIRQFQELKELSDQLNERSREIQAQNRELENASRLKSEFLASMSHELRTPLNAIIGFSELLMDGLREAQHAEHLDYATEVFQSGRHLLSLINDILDLSKIEAGKMDLDVESIDMSTLVAGALTIIRERAMENRISLTHAVAPDVGRVEADARKLRQIIYNLLSNAVKFTPKGGRVRIEVTRTGDQVELAVSDSGIGIAPADKARLFRPFEQLDAGLARKFEGTGLGLVMVKNLVELHGGSVGVESELGRGSRFWVRFPAKRPPAFDAQPAASDARLPRR